MAQNYNASEVSFFATLDHVPEIEVKLV